MSKKKNPGKDDMMQMVILIGGGFAIWWYLNNFNGNGQVSASNPNSFWSQWFGGAAQAAVPPAQTGTGTQTGSGTGTGTGSGTTGTGAGNPPPPPPVQTGIDWSTTAARLQAAAGSGAMYDTNQWLWFWQNNQTTFSNQPPGWGNPTGISPSIAAALATATGDASGATPMTLAAFLNGMKNVLPTSGMSGIVNLPMSTQGKGMGSMSFGGGFGNGFSAKKGWVQ